MPAVTFFAMRAQGNYIHAKHMSELIDITVTSGAKIAWYKTLKSSYKMIMDQVNPHKSSITVPDSPEFRPPGAPILDAGSKEARTFMLSMFRQFSRATGHG